MLMSQDAISSGEATRPSPGPSASAADDSTSKLVVIMARRLGIDVPHLTVFADGPAGDPIKVIDRLRAAFRDQTGTGRLNIARLVYSAALQDCGATTPAPPNPEAGQCFRQNRLLKGRRRPAVPTIGRDFDLAYLAV